METKKEVEILNDELIELRRDFHKHPELGYEEYRTSEIVYKYLEKCGLEVKRIAKTGVVGLLRGKQEGKTAMLRADMDALPLQEINDIEYKSVYDGKMHACGHDGHTAMLLIAAKILSRHRDKIKGNVKFVFQPNEEGAGALDMINAGVLEEPKVDAAFGLHLWTPIESGKIGIVNGPIMAACEVFKISVLGKGGHTSSPHTAVDPIIVASNIVQAVQTIQTREINVIEPTVIMFGKIQGGSAPNVIPDKVELEGTMRFLYKDEQNGKEKLKERFERIVKGICYTMNADYELKYSSNNNPAIMNDDVMVEIVRQTAKKTLNTTNCIVPHVCMAGEDFSEFTRRVPSAFYFIGTGNKEKGTDYPHHHSNFNIDEETLAIGVEMHVRTILNYFNEKEI